MKHNGKMCQLQQQKNKRKQDEAEEDKGPVRTSCEVGVRQSRTPGRWEAHITLRGPGSSGYVHLGTFRTREMASEVRKHGVQMKKQHGRVDAKTLKRMVREAFPEGFKKFKKARTPAAAAAEQPATVV
jgi:hypothetical protein